MMSKKNKGKKWKSTSKKQTDTRVEKMLERMEVNRVKQPIDKTKRR